MQFANALITRIHSTLYAWVNIRFAAFKQLKIVISSLAKRSADDFSTVFICHYLCFLRVAFLFTGVVASLFFLGRSTGVSVTSTNTTSNVFSGAAKAFLPGK